MAPCVLAGPVRATGSRLALDYCHPRRGDARRGIAGAPFSLVGCQTPVFGCFHAFSAYCVIRYQMLMVVAVAFAEVTTPAPVEISKAAFIVKRELIVVLRNADLCSTALRKLIVTKSKYSLRLAPKIRLRAPQSRKWSACKQNGPSGPGRGRVAQHPAPPQ